MNPISLAILGLGAITNASLYFIFVFLAAQDSANLNAMHLAITAAGVTYMSFVAQLYGNWTKLSWFLVGLSFLCGAAAGLALLV